MGDQGAWDPALRPEQCLPWGGREQVLTSPVLGAVGGAGQCVQEGFLAEVTLKWRPEGLVELAWEGKRGMNGIGHSKY